LSLLLICRRVKEIDESIKIGNYESMKSTKIGNLKCEVSQVNGEKLTITLKYVKYVPNLCVNLFSLNKALKKGFEVSNDGVVISHTYKHVKLTFDRFIHATYACVTGVLIKRIFSNIINGFANASIIYIKYLDIAVKMNPKIHLKCMGLSPLVILIHVNSMLSQRHDRKL
jgi:hypothetical protein